MEIQKAFEIYNILNGIPKLTVHLLGGMRASLIYTNAALNYLAEFTLKDNLCAVAIHGSPARLSNPKHSLVNYTRNGTVFLDPATGLSKTAVAIQTAKNEIIKISDRLIRIAHFTASQDPINFDDFTLADDTFLQHLIDDI